MLHHFTSFIAHTALPEKFTYPFHYTPHPICVIAAEEVQTYLSTPTGEQEKWQQGKMFGVLVVQTPTGDIGFLAAFSGNAPESSQPPYFVPPVYDLLQPEGFFKREEEQISALNARIKQLETDEHYEACKQCLLCETTLAEQASLRMKAEMRAAKEARESRRRSALSEEEAALLIRESQYQKAEFKRQEQAQRERLAEIQTEIEEYATRINALKTERRTRSAALQQQLFRAFNMLNARGECKDLCQLFEDTPQKVPPAGAGECAAPKLLQYAYLHQLKPIAMAEFWWGNSPKTEIRRHGFYYPACKGKCEPILRHMLQGLEVDENPLLNTVTEELEIVYEDDSLLVVNKPAGMLSVPGKEAVSSVYEWAKTNYPQATGPLIVHRLDMATSGLLLLAKTKEAHQELQSQFEKRSIQKRYVALLDGIVTREEGEINLPLCPDLLDRPRQVVDKVHGKEAFTHYGVLARANGMTYIALYPQTGRTHQLRVHSAHSEGLNCPIVGDELYGKKAERLYLHAESVTFRHPVSGELISIEKRTDFGQKMQPAVNS